MRINTVHRLNPPIGQFNGHLQTIIPSLFRKIEINYEREKLKLPDDDFLLLDWSKANKPTKKILIASHGLEGDSSQQYIKGLAKVFNQDDYDVLAWNFRSCGGQMNKKPKFYSQEDTSDFLEVIHHVLYEYAYDEIVLAGFSLGGAMTLRYCAKQGEAINKRIKATITASVPLDLKECVDQLNRPQNRIYRRRFLSSLEHKVSQKKSLLGFNCTKAFKTFQEFDNIYTASHFGYENALDYYVKSSVRPILDKIAIPSLIVQAKNDPFLTPHCFDLGVGESNSNLKLVVTKYGGHVGFAQKDEEISFVEKIGLEFVKGLK